jgi:lipopolysaccharide export system protein LptA
MAQLEKNILKTIFIFMTMVFSFSGYTQVSGQVEIKKSDRIQIVNADRLIKKKNSTAQKFIGNVQLVHQDVILYCDSAFLFLDSNNLQAFGNVRILQGDSLSLIGDSLHYVGSLKLATMRGNVKMDDRDMHLETPSLKYNLKDSVGRYTEGAIITSKKNQNVLTSNVGLYYSNGQTLEFRDSVKLVNPQYEMTSDTLTYNTVTEKAFFSGETFIISDSNVIYTENGWYDTKNDRASFRKNSYIISDGQKLQGDSLYYDRNMGIGEVFRNMQITDTANNIIIRGHYGWHDEHLNRSLITDSLLLIQVFDDDSLFLHSDTALIVQDSLGNKNIHAFHHVKFFKKDMQGASDSLVFNQSDSTIKMYIYPVLWSEGNQLSADFISIKTDSSSIESMKLDQNAFLISEADTVGYNQIKGRIMDAYFSKNQLSKLDVFGNAQSVYYVGEEGKKMTGLNHTVCSNMTLKIKDNTVDRITFRDQPDAVLYPIHKINPKVKILQGFKWEAELRPEKIEDIYTW